MAVFHTPGDPPSSGSSSLTNSGCTQNSSSALTKRVTANSGMTPATTRVDDDAKTGASSGAKMSSGTRSPLRLDGQGATPGRPPHANEGGLAWGKGVEISFA